MIGSGLPFALDRRSLLAGAAAAAAGIAAPLRAMTPDGRQPPRFSGPIPVTTTSKPWASAMDFPHKAAIIKYYDYVEEEYFVTGTCAVYGPDGEVVRTTNDAPREFAAQLRPLGRQMRTGVPYTTRAIVIRPRDMGKFSGRVHLIPNHNLNADTRTDKNLLRGGDVWIGLEVNSGARFGVEERPSGGVAHLRRFDPQRYAAMSIPAGDVSDWPGLRQPGILGQTYKTLDLGGRVAPPEQRNVFRQEISRSYAQAPDIMSDVAAVIRNGAPTSPLAGHKVRRIYTSGSSGQSTILQPYVDFHHAAAAERLGHVPFDAYMIRVGVWPATRPRGAVLVQVQSEAEVMKPLKPGELEEVANTDDPMFRFYEIPGVGHGLTARAPSVEGGIGKLVPEGVIGISATQGTSAFQRYDKIALPVQWAMWSNIDTWLDGGAPMPRAPNCARDAAAPDQLARDRHGNVIGGLRLPWMDVPDAEYTGIIHDNNPLEGGMKPFGEAKMKELYGSQAAYEAKIDERLEQMARERWIEARDIPLMRMRGDTDALNLGFYEAKV